MNKAAAEEVVVQEAAESSVVVSYMDVFENYYMQACDQLQEKNITMPFTLDQFSEAYYTHDMDIAEYTQTVVSYVK